MSYRHVLVAVAITPESHRLVQKAVSIVKPVNGKITLVTLASDPELYNQLAAPMLESLRDLMLEETHLFLDELKEKAQYPVEKVIISTGELSEHILDICEKHDVDLVLCGNHNQSFFSKVMCSAKTVVASSRVDVLLVPL
ncbi:universal stress protein UspC [Cedecea neteri]|uniref:Universal stress protein n=1 Tax=Cedecea neteri TaxID=158822 RepID=A0AAN0S8F6_9ENTR|nr:MULTISPECIES: universal stress protein UspC [Cedecea]AIR62775.1 universal stress protein UspC [Cedecea neteri]NIG76685.1 universal stress protein UspC [Klebsiella sp. Ap-873]WNJ81364.1 universal stress protein UspC [Cedecea neteri]SMG58778.1 universal stress protein C [Cedecea sp. NFIX57]